MKSPMQIAVEEALWGIEHKEGGPFGAVIVQGEHVIAKGHNRVIATNDPTAHAEIVAIRAAAERLGRFDLSDCILFTTCEPCPMCYSAAHWAKIPVVYYGATREDAQKVGFDDNLLYEVLSGSIENPNMKVIPKDRDICIEPFIIYEKDTEKKLY